MNILVTGGAGYIGSHTCLALLEAGHSVIIADNLSNSKSETVLKVMDIANKKVTFYEIDVTDAEAIDIIFKNYKIDGVIHFAGLKAVGESVEKPIEYYYNNIVSTLVLAKACQKYGVTKFFLVRQRQYMEITKYRLWRPWTYYLLQTHMVKRKL